MNNITIPKRDSIYGGKMKTSDFRRALPFSDNFLTR